MQNILGGNINLGVNGVSSLFSTVGEWFSTAITDPDAIELFNKGMINEQQFRKKYPKATIKRSKYGVAVDFHQFE